MSKKVLIIVIIIVIAGIAGYFLVNRETSTQNNSGSTNSTTSTWEEVIYNQFRNLTDWRIKENLSDWGVIDLDRNKLDNFPKGKLFQISKSFNETGFPGPNVDQQIQQAANELKALENSVKKVLADNGWKFVAGPTEGGFYHDYLYVKDNRPLILQIGTRDAVTGGMYVSVQFLYSPQLTSCNENSPPSLTVISPNGGETYSAGQQITVRWRSCNVDQPVGITLSGYPYPSSTQFFLGSWGAANIGSQVVSIPATAPVGNYIVNIATPPESSPGAEDWSDISFQIK